MQNWWHNQITWDEFGRIEIILFRQIMFIYDWHLLKVCSIIFLSLGAGSNSVWLQNHTCFFLTFTVITIDELSMHSSYPMWSCSKRINILLTVLTLVRVEKRACNIVTRSLCYRDSKLEKAVNEAKAYC